MYGIDDATLKQFDEENKACDRFLRQQRARLEQAQVQEKSVPHADNISIAKVQSLINTAVEAAKDELVDLIGEELGRLFKEIDGQVRDIIRRITDDEKQLRHLLTERADSRDQRTTFELDSMKETLHDIVTKIELVRKGETMPIRRPN